LKSLNLKKNNDIFNDAPSSDNILVFDPESTFYTRSKSGKTLLRYKVDEKGTPEAKTKISLDEDTAATNIVYVDDLHISKFRTKNKALCTVTSIDEEQSFATIKMSLPKGELLREIELSLLKRLNLGEIGKEFYFMSIDKPKGCELILEPYIPEYDHLINDALDELEKYVE
jgi:hypothetical protein